MLIYITMLGGTDPQQQIVFATHLITKSVISAPAALMIAKILLPQTESVCTDITISKEKTGSNLLDAICIGTTGGPRLAVNIGGMLFAPVAWLMGIDGPWILASGQLLGTRTVLMILTYALCGFANIVSIGIQVDGIGALAPTQRSNLARLDIKALIGCSLACFLTACVAGMLT